MRYLTLLLLAGALLAIPARGATIDEVEVPKGYEAAQLPLGKVLVRKQPFAVRHPKLHKAGRKIRKTAQIFQPIVSFVGSVAQVAVAVRK
jgi:hypothetical protein